MKTYEKIMLGTMAILVIAVIGLALSLKKAGVLGSTQTTATYATAASVTNQGGLYLYDTESNSGLEVAGYARLRGAVSLEGGNATITTPVTTGAVGAISTTSATYSLAATNVCDNTLLAFTSLAAATTVTLPASSTLFADCLPSVGATYNLNYISATTGTVLAAGAGGTLKYSSSSTIAAGKAAEVRFIRNTTLTYLVYVVNILN